MPAPNFTAAAATMAGDWDADGSITVYLPTAAALKLLERQGWTIEPVRGGNAYVKPGCKRRADGGQFRYRLPVGARRRARARDPRRGAAMSTLRYDGASRPITLAEAERIADLEYDARGSSMYSRGSDGGMHWRGAARSPAAALGWAQEQARGLVRRIMAGECTFTVFYDRARDRFYCG